MFSFENQFEIEVRRRSPKVDPLWLKFNPTHAPFEFDANGNRQTLIHHHVDQKNLAVALPEKAHQQYSSYLHGKYRSKSTGLKTKAQIKNAIRGASNSLSVIGFLLDAKGIYAGDPHTDFAAFEIATGNQRMNTLYFSSEGYVETNQISEFTDSENCSGFHAGWERVVYVNQYVDYAYDLEQGRYVGIGKLADGYIVQYNDGRDPEYFHTKCYLQFRGCNLL